MTIIFFYGTECATCHKVEPILDKLASEKGITVEKKETYHNSENQTELMKMAEGKCSQLPFLINTENDKFVCGDADETKLNEFFE